MNGAMIEAFLDVMPGETRGIVMRDGVPEHLLIQRESDIAQHRLGARSVGRIVSVEIGLKGAFVDLGAVPPLGFLPFGKNDLFVEGQAVEVIVTAELREAKGPTLRRIGQGREMGQGTPRLLTAGPSVEEGLGRLAPGVTVQTGVAAIQASWDAEEAALATGDVFADVGLDLAVQRTRAMIAVDLDHVGPPGRDARKGQAQANLVGVRQAARLIRLKRWGGLVAIDLVGTGQDGDAVMAATRAAFGDDPDVVVGPLNRFGVLMLSLPWRMTPIEDLLNEGDRVSTRTRALDLVRRVRHAMLSDTGVPRFEVRCAPVEADIASPLIARLGPRARLVADPDIRPGRGTIKEA